MSAAAPEVRDATTGAMLRLIHYPMSTLMNGPCIWPSRPYSNGIGLQIQCREDWDTLQEMEQMGGKIRDTKNEYVGAQGRDDKTQLMLSPRYTIIHSYLPESLFPKLILKSNPDHKPNNVVIRVWGSTFKPALKKECQRLGVKIFDRVMATSLADRERLR